MVMYSISDLDREELEKAYEDCCSELDFIELDLHEGKIGEALEKIKSSQRRRKDLVLSVDDGTTEIIPFDRKLAMYERLYHLMFHAVTDALKKMDQERYTDAAVALATAQSQAEEIYIDDVMFD